MVRTLGLSLAAFSFACTTGSSAEVDRREEQLDRTAVHFHLALRARLEGPDGRRTAEALVEAGRSDARAESLARAVYADRADGRTWLHEDRRARVTWSSLRDPDSSIDPATDAAGLFLALLEREAVNGRLVPDEVLVYEASRLSVEEVEDPALRQLTRASRALVFARAGYCEQAEREAQATLDAGSDRSAIHGSLERWVAGLPEQDATTADVERAVSVLAGAARACCATSEGDDERAARSIARWIDDAERLGVSPGRVALLRGWAALARGEREEARAQLVRIHEEDAGLEASRYRLLRDALAAAPESHALENAPLVDRRWLSEVALRGVHRAFEEDGLLAELDEHAETRAMRELAAGYVAVVAAAREAQPMFDQAHAGDHGSLERIAQLFRDLF